MLTRLRRILHGMVAHPRELQVILDLQRYTGHQDGKAPALSFSTIHWYLLHRFMELVSVSATGVVFILLFPFWSCGALGYSRVTVHLCIMMMLAQAVTSLIKDAVGLARPVDKKLVRVGGDNYKAEFSFPSGHSSGAMCLAYINARAVLHYFYPSVAASPFAGDSTALVIYSIGLVYVLLVALSRVYLGMHWPGDVIAGLAVGMGICSCHLLGGELVLDYLLVSGSLEWGGIDVMFAASTVVLAAFLLIRFHPTPNIKCPCIIDTARFVGAGVGALLGVWCDGEAQRFISNRAAAEQYRARLPLGQDFLDLQRSVKPADTWLGVGVRTVVAMMVMVVAELVIKNIAEPIFDHVLVPAFPTVFSDDAERTLKRNWKASYIWSRFVSHIAFSFALLFGAPLYIHLLPA